MRITLIQPPNVITKSEMKSCHPPLGLAYLAAALNERHEVNIIDAIAEGYDHEERSGHYIRYGLSLEDIKRLLLKFAPDVVGISCLFSAVADEVYRICALVKEVNKNTYVILGGAHPSVLPKETLEDRNIDFVVIGEGEDTLSELLSALEGKSDLSEIYGLAYRNEKDIKVNSCINYRNNLDALKFPDWTKLPLGKYYQINRPHGGMVKRLPFLPMITSRGCPNRCSFCSIHSVWGHEYRRRSAENVLSEVETLIKAFGVKEILFEDDNLTLDRQRTKEIFKGIILRGFDVLWSAPNGVAVNTLRYRDT